MRRFTIPDESILGQPQYYMWIEAFISLTTTPGNKNTRFADCTWRVLQLTDVKRAC